MWVGTGVLVLVVGLVLLVMPTFAAIPTLALYRFVVRLLDEPVYRVQVLWSMAALQMLLLINIAYSLFKRLS